ncbi:hypothetical protein [Nocardia sp. BMG111209]|nr:hypothetical protein [Nocardia sp. BMG111209]
MTIQPTAIPDIAPTRTAEFDSAVTTLATISATEPGVPASVSSRDGGPRA